MYISIYLSLSIYIYIYIYTRNRHDLYGDETACKFYLANVTLAFEHLYTHKIVHRDLKPENLLLTQRGYLKVADFGLAKIVLGKTFTTCGTPDYFAPELMNGTGYNHSVDWWTLGVFMYELLAGRAPFAAANQMDIMIIVMIIMIIIIIMIMILLIIMHIFVIQIYNQ